MNEGLPLTNANTKKRNLTIRFCVAAIVVTSLLVMAMTIASYFQMREQALQANLDTLVKNIDLNLADEIASVDLSDRANNEVLQKIQSLPGVVGAALYNFQQQLVWRSSPSLQLSVKERLSFGKFIDGEARSKVFDHYTPRFDSLDSFFGNNSRPISSLVKLVDAQGKPIAILQLVRNYDFTLEGARRTTLRNFWYILAGNLLLFFALFYNFWRGLQTIENQEIRLSQQISRLSNLLSINRNMQKSMKTASSRAVELNEQFLRRVGSDLHDGPAQSLGYAILRLNRIAEDEGAKAFSHEFHSVRQALDSSLEEIRGISSGLVLPELEEMTLTQALKKVVSRHAMHADTEVSEYFQDLPDNIALPIKITAYRFVQEGLNNAHRHGQAEKCRITAQVKDDVLHISLKDNGMGFRKSQLSTEGGHLGLMGLKDRIESLGGRFTINSELGVGTAIKVSIAISDDALPI